MDDLIRRQDAIDAFWKLEVEIRPSAIYAIDEMLKQLPSANVRESRKGNWGISYIPSKDEIEMEYCSECGWGKMIEEKREYNFCPNCGEDMRGEQDE